MCRPSTPSYGDVADSDGLAHWGEASRALGFEGMGCIHPGQIPIIHRAYAPTAKEIEKALKIVAAFEDAQQRGLGVVSLGLEDDRSSGRESRRETGRAREADGTRTTQPPQEVSK